MKLKLSILATLILGAFLLFKGAATPAKLTEQDIAFKYGCNNLAFSSEDPSPYCQHPENAPELKRSTYKYVYLTGGTVCLISGLAASFVVSRREQKNASRK